MSEGNKSNGWGKHEMYVVESLKELREEIKQLRQEIQDHMDNEEQTNIKMAESIGKLKGRAMSGGAASGAAVAMLIEAASRVFGA